MKEKKRERRERKRKRKKEKKRKREREKERKGEVGQKVGGCRGKRSEKIQTKSTGNLQIQREIIAKENNIGVGTEEKSTWKQVYL